MTSDSHNPSQIHPAKSVLLCCLSLLGGLLMASLGCHNSYPYPGAPFPNQFPTAPFPTAPNPSAPTAWPQGAPSGFPPSQMSQFGPAVAPTQPQMAELQRRVQQLDDNNRQLTTQLAQAQQQSQASYERAELLAKQLGDATNQNRQLMATAQQAANQARGLQASMNSRGGATLTANNSLANSSAGIQVPGARVINEGGLTRMRFSSDQLFNPGTAQLNPSSAYTLDQLAAGIIRQYPRQRIAIEGHSDSTQPFGGTFANGNQLSGAQAQAVMDHLVRRGGVPVQQLFVVAQGPSQPIADNQTAAGRAENRRIDILVYPEVF